MARTAPVPNMAAIPGMNPGLFVMGGGAGDGAGGAGGGNGNANGQGANGQNGGNGANGGGNGTGACGQGSGGPCTNCSARTAAGDPVDVATGEVFTVPSTDLSLPGPVNLSLQRVYSLRNRELNVGVGFGWGHSLAWRFALKDGLVDIRSGLGQTYRIHAPGDEQSAMLPGGLILLRRGRRFVLDTKNEFVHVFSPLEGLPEQDNYRLTAVVHRTNNGFRLEYDNHGRLIKIIDAAGRKVLVGTDRSGNVTTLRVEDPRTGQGITFARYSYDDAENLVTHTDADGGTTSYAYDDDHRLVLQTLPNGLRFHYLYDDAGRCTETWGDHPDGNLVGIDPDAPGVLADGVRARGILHTRLTFGEDYTEVADSIRLLRFFIDPETKQIIKGVAADGGVSERVLDESGNVISHTDALGATTTYAWDWRGRLLAQTDALGGTFAIERDEQGRVVRTTDAAGHSVECQYDEQGNRVLVRDQLGGTTRQVFDSYGLLTYVVNVLGAVTRYMCDEHANVETLITPTGARWHWRWDYFGRPVMRTDPLGAVRTWEYSPGGRVLRVREGGTQVEFDYDSMGNLTRVTTDAGSSHYRWGWLRWQLGASLLSGEEIRYSYNREGWLTTLEDSAGQRARYEYDPAGNVTSETSFDGHRREFSRDLMGRLIQIEDPTGKTQITRDVLGRVVSIDFPDDRTHSFERDELGRVSKVRFPNGSIQFNRNAAGDVTRETRTVGDASDWIEWSRDLSGAPIAMHTSWGHEEHYRRDRMGFRRVTSAVTPGFQPMVIKERRNALGMLLGRLLPGGGRVENEFDEGRRLVRTRVLPAGDLTSQAGTPGWVGERERPLLQKSFAYGLQQNLVHRRTEPGPEVQYEYDLRQRLRLERRQDRSLRFGVDLLGNLLESPEGERSYDGQRLVRHRDVHFEYDDVGRLTRRVRRAGPGDEEVTTFRWNAQGQLEEVELPDRKRVQHSYDTFGRRLGTSVRLPSGQTQVERRFTWLGNRLLREQVLEADRPALERIYIGEDERTQPIAHLEKTGDSVAGPFFYVTDPILTPEEIVDGTGAIVGNLEREPWGASRGGGKTTPVRFDGQYEDPETGLHYNRYRYYDPAVGRYISPDPIGLEGGVNAYAYAPNPVGFVDPLGLKHHCSCSLEMANGTTWVPDSSSGLEGEGGAEMPGRVSGRRNEQRPGGANDLIPGAIPVEGSGRRREAGPETELVHDHRAHTEQQSIEWAEHHFTRAQLRNSTMRLGGEMPPCPRCHAAMQDFARRNGSTVEYHFPNNNRITYDGRNDSNPFRPVSPEAMRSDTRMSTSGPLAGRLIDGPASSSDSRGYRQMENDGVNPEALGVSPMNQLYQNSDGTGVANQTPAHNNTDHQDPNRDISYGYD